MERLSQASKYDKASLNEATLAKKQCIKLSKSEGVGRLMTDRKAVKAPTHVAHSQIDNHRNASGPPQIPRLVALVRDIFQSYVLLKLARAHTMSAVLAKGDPLWHLA